MTRDLIFTVFALRRNSILIVNGLSVVGACLMSASKVSKSFEVLIVGRLVFGLFCGLVMTLNPLYIQEVSPTNLRGAFATLNQVSFATGILVGMVRTLFMPGVGLQSHCTALMSMCSIMIKLSLDLKRCGDCGRPGDSSFSNDGVLTCVLGLSIFRSADTARPAWFIRLLIRHQSCLFSLSWCFFVFKG